MSIDNTLNPIDIVIGKAVRKRREASGHTTAQTADAICVSHERYELSESGHLPFQASDLLMLAEYFGCRARDLMPSESSLSSINSGQGYGEPEEVRDLIHFFSGVVSPHMRRFFLKQIQDASIQAPVHQDLEPVSASPQSSGFLSKLTFLRQGAA